MTREVTQCSMCTHYNTEQYCEVWEQYITNDAFYCACGVNADRKTENSSVFPNNCDTCKYGEDKHRYAHICNECGVGINNYEPKTEPQTERSSE